ncbi:RING finger domain-containing protein [Reticulomyxa filosa]|uniref:RING finger domain-containing protein n=1 Tax=Reticulomyxa filosa TaxID=46433 RepID=X6NER6_RETFI|nr:RING finger domain-containing protein [Reticulomyxa filosa]|eukprot:ETO23832.1 RING finger domain-containing protein [Reticulomyxa filosa]
MCLHGMALKDLTAQVKMDKVIENERMGKNHQMEELSQSKSRYSYVYQSMEGQYMLLDPLNWQMLRSEYMSSSHQKNTISSDLLEQRLPRYLKHCKILQIEKFTFTPQLKQRFKWLSSILPFNADFGLVEIDMTNLVSKQVYQQYQHEIEKKERFRQRMQQEKEAYDKLQKERLERQQQEQKQKHEQQQLAQTAKKALKLRNHPFTRNKKTMMDSNIIRLIPNNSLNQRQTMGNKMEINMVSLKNTFKQLGGKLFFGLIVRNLFRDAPFILPSRKTALIFHFCFFKVIDFRSTDSSCKIFNCQMLFETKELANPAKEILKNIFKDL